MQVFRIRKDILEADLVITFGAISHPYFAGYGGGEADIPGSATFLPWFDMGGWDTAFDHLYQVYQGNGGTGLAMMAKTRRIEIFPVTDLSPDGCRAIGVTRLDPPSAANRIRRYRGSIAAIPNASLLVRRWTRRH